MLADGHPEVAVEGLEGDLDGVDGAGLAAGSVATRARWGTAKGQRTRPRNCTSAASNPVAVASDSTAGSASARVADSSTTVGASSTALMAKPHQRSTSRLPPAAKRSRTCRVGWRRMSG
jgi:hypothetical protein